jgi:hypothetical protein
MISKLKTEIELLKIELRFSQLENKVYKQIILNSNLPENVKTCFDNFQTMVEENIKEIVKDFKTSKKENTKEHTKEIVKEHTKEHTKENVKTKKKIETDNTSDRFSIELELDDIQLPIEPLKEDNTEQKMEQKVEQTKSEQPKIDQSKPEDKIDTKLEHKKTFKRVNEFVRNTEEELHANIEKKIEEVEKKYEKIILEKGDADTIKQKIDLLFEKLKSSKIYQSIIIEIKKERTNLLGIVSIIDYIKILETHYNALKSYFEGKGYSPKKIQEMLLKSMTTIDLRLGHFKGYTTTTLEPDDMENFSNSLNLFIDHKKDFIPYDNISIYSNIKNYSIAIFDLKNCIKRCIVNTYGCNNIVYVNYSKSTKDDPYTFYVLKKVDKSRSWIMDCRLENFSLCLVSNVLPYCVDLFRKIYKDVFEDNIYREGYMNKLNETKDECDQLLSNIITLSKPMEMCKLIQNIVLTNCEITPSEIDKFDFYGDDKIQQKKFQKHFTEQIKENSIDTILSLFDNITDDDAIKLLNEME